MYANNLTSEGNWTYRRVSPAEAVQGHAHTDLIDDKVHHSEKVAFFDASPSMEPAIGSDRARAATKKIPLTDTEFETLLDIALGLTDRAIARRRHLSVRGVQNRLSMLLHKLLHGEDAHLRETADMEIFNVRTRIIFESLKRGLIDVDKLSSLEGDLAEWLEDEFKFERIR